MEIARHNSFWHFYTLYTLPNPKSSDLQFMSCFYTILMWQWSELSISQLLILFFIISEWECWISIEHFLSFWSTYVTNMQIRSNCEHWWIDKLRRNIKISWNVNFKFKLYYFFTWSLSVLFFHSKCFMHTQLTEWLIGWVSNFQWIN